MIGWRRGEYCFSRKDAKEQGRKALIVGLAAGFFSILFLAIASCLATLRRNVGG